MLEAKLAVNPFPSTPVASQIYADRLGGEAWKRTRDDLLAMANSVRRSGYFGAAVIVGPPGAGKTHICMNVKKELSDFFPIYVDASVYPSLETGIMESMQKSSVELGFHDFADYVSYRVYEYAITHDEELMRKKLRYETKDRLFYLSFKRYLLSLRNGHRYLTKDNPFLVRALAKRLKVESLSDFLSEIPVVAEETGNRFLLIVDETETSYERELKVIYNAQPRGLLLITTFVPDRWADIKDKALKDRFYSASLFRQLGYPREDDLEDIIMSYLQGHEGFTREWVSEVVKDSGFTDIRDALRKLHDAYEACSGSPDCIREHLSGIVGNKGELSRTIERYVRSQVLPSLKNKGFISYFADKGKRIPSLNSVIDIVFATDDVLYLADVKIIDSDSLLQDLEASVLRASRLAGIELNGKVYSKIRSFVITNRPGAIGFETLTLTPEEINLIKDGFNPLSVEEKFSRILKA